MHTKKLVSKELPKSKFRSDDLLKSKSEPIYLLIKWLHVITGCLAILIRCFNTAPNSLLVGCS